MCLAQGHNTVMPMRLEPAALRSRVNHSTTEPLRSLMERVKRASCFGGYATTTKVQTSLHIHSLISAFPANRLLESVRAKLVLSKF